MEKEEKKQILEELSLGILEVQLQKFFKWTQPVKLVKEMKEGRWGIPRIEIRSKEPVTPKCGIFGKILEYCYITSFSGGEVYDNGQVWGTINLSYQHKRGGSNGMEICNYWYNIEEKKWRFEFVGQKRLKHIKVN